MRVVRPQGRPGRGGARSGPHTALVRACLVWLQLHKIEAWKNNTGAFVSPATASKRRSFVRASLPGIADIIGLVPHSGRFLAIECKTGRGVLSDDQLAFQARVKGSGGVFLEVWSIDDLEAARAALLCGYSLTR